MKKNIKYARKAIFAGQIINKGDQLSEKNLVIKRPAVGLSPIHWNKIIKLKAIKKYLKNEKISKKICIISSGRADYGLLRNLIKKLSKSKRFKFHLSVTGTHLSVKHGNTIREILKRRDKNKLKIKNIKL